MSNKRIGPLKAGPTVPATWRCSPLAPRLVACEQMSLRAIIADAAICMETMFADGCRAIEFVDDGGEQIARFAQSSVGALVGVNDGAGGPTGGDRETHQAPSKSFQPVELWLILFDESVAVTTPLNHESLSVH
jgi:hypothetical protein